MARRLKLFDDELRAKKVITKLERDSKSSHNYKKKNYSTNKNENNPRGKEAVIKITGNTKNLESFKRHIEYITREYELPLYDNDGNKYEGKDEIKDYIDMYNFDNAIPDYDETLNKERREVLNFVFSMKEQNTTPKDKLMEAVIKSVKEKYPDNPACFSFHGDTDNPHIHCDLKIQSLDGKRIDVKIADLQKLRKDYAKNLRDLGIEAYATRKYEKYNLDKDKNIVPQDKEVKIAGANEEKIKNHHYEIVDFGKAKYKFDENSKDSYFVKYKSTKGEIIDIWSEHLESLVKEKDIKIGEYVKFKIVDKQPIEVTHKRKGKNGKTIAYTKKAFKNVWDCSILGRDEKELKMNKNVENRKQTYSSKAVISELERKNAEFIRMKKEKELKEAPTQSKGNKFAHLKKKSTDVER
ncbi:MobP1 family relaxase [Aliarcobacter cryaerophilus]|uniref:Spore coat protein CotH n=1 Tax=Aliarcobacter cryaerophilus TaxID=28198 RepID=A0AA46N089_9BACT|nr:MobP1 family relaxase [Aliarcobacter cryaerophilus]UYF42556.1 spore coat protein CotH [Aliarcobacter cryaerophilus]